MMVIPEAATQRGVELLRPVGVFTMMALRLHVGVVQRVAGLTCTA